MATGYSPGRHACSAGINGAAGTFPLGMGDDLKSSQRLREQAERCRRLARATTDPAVTRRLLELAAEFDELANSEERRSRCC